MLVLAKVARGEIRVNEIPGYVRRHLNALGVGDAGIDSIIREMNKAQLMSREELAKAIEVKNDAIRLLRVQQAVFLSLLERTHAKQD